MDVSRFTEKMQDALRAAQSTATRHNHQQLEVEHLLLALLDQQNGLASAILSKAGVSTDLLRQRLEEDLDRMPRVTSPSGASADQIYVTGRLNRLLVQA